MEWPRAAVIAEQARRGNHYAIEPGTVAVIVQHARALWEGKVVITARILGVVEPEDDINHGDTCRIVGAEQTIDMRVAGGLNSAATTAAVLLNMIEPLLAAEAGLRTMANFPVRAVAAKPARRR